MSASDDFIQQANKTVGNQYEAMQALDSGDPAAVMQLAAQWNVQLSQQEAEGLIQQFQSVLDLPPDDDAVKLC